MIISFLCLDSANVHPEASITHAFCLFKIMADPYFESKRISEVILDGSLKECWSLVQIGNLLAEGRDGFSTDRPAIPLDAPFVVRVKERECP
jgi:hypothetical protein